MLKKLLTLVFLSSQLVGATPGWNGHWTLMPEKTQAAAEGLPPASNLEVTLQGEALVILGEEGGEQRLQLGGAATPFQMERAGPGGFRLKGSGTRAASLKEDQLVILEQAQVRAPFGTFSMRREQHWRLEKQGDQLWIQVEAQTPRGTKASTLVYQRT